MSFNFWITIGIIFFSFLAAVVILYFRSAPSAGRKKFTRSSPRESSHNLQKAEQALTVDENNPKALHLLANSQFEMKQWKEAADSFDKLLSLSQKKSGVFTSDIPYKLGVAALNAKMYNRAAQALELARSTSNSSFKINYALGRTEYLRNNFMKAQQYLRFAMAVEPNDFRTQRLLGLSLLRAGKNSEAVPLLKKVFMENPNDLAIKFHYAKASQQQGNLQQAMELYDELKENLHYGPFVNLQIGNYELFKKNFSKAITHFQIGLSFREVPREIFLDLNYNAAESCTKLYQFSKGLAYLQAIAAVEPTYKDVPQKLELYSNKNLHVFLLGDISKFTKLAEDLLAAIYPKSIRRILTTNETYIDTIWALDLGLKIGHGTQTEMVLVRLVRSTEIIGDTFIRELYTKIQSSEYNSSLCISAADFSEMAYTFVQSRAIRLIPRSELMELFKKL